MHLEVKHEDVAVDAPADECTTVQINAAVEIKQESFDTSYNLPCITTTKHLSTVSDSQMLNKDFPSDSKCQLDVLLSGAKANGAVETSLAYCPGMKVKHSVMLPKHLETRLQPLTKASSVGSISTFSAREKIKTIVEMMESINASTYYTVQCNSIQETKLRFKYLIQNIKSL